MAHRKKTSQRQWYRMDLHLHTPASADYKQTNVSYLDFMKKAEEKNLDVISFTDHNSVNGYARYLEEVESLELLERLKRLRDDERKTLDEYRRLREKILVLPGFEFTATLGFHILGIFPPETSVRELEHLLLSLRVPPDKLDQGSGEVGATTDALTAYRMIDEAGGMAIAAHANSSHGVAMPGFDFGGQTRIAYTQDPNLLALEVTDLESRSRRRTAAFFSGTKPEYPRRMHCIQGSDAHKLIFDSKFKNEMGVGDRATEILLEELSFEAIKEVFRGNDFSRTRPFRSATDEPFDPIREAREQGDSLIQAFHERLFEKRSIARNVLEDVVALANTNGGTIYIGASANAHQAVVGVDNPERAITELRGVIAKDIMPPLDVQIEVLKSQGKNVLQVIVPRGSEVPYALESSHIYVRSENETGLAVRDEIIQLVRDALMVELAAMGIPSAAKPIASGEPVTTEQKVEESTTTAAVLAAPPPRTGVEIVSADIRKGIWYYSVRDLRNERVVHNVTLKSARRLWQYAIVEHEKHPIDPEKLTWVDDIAIAKAYKRGGKMRYDFVQRSSGKTFVYYGVTEDGIHGPWRKLVDTNGTSENEDVPEVPETVIEITEANTELTDQISEDDETFGFGEPIPPLPEETEPEESEPLMMSEQTPAESSTEASPIHPVPETEQTTTEQLEAPRVDFPSSPESFVPPTQAPTESHEEVSAHAEQVPSRVEPQESPAEETAPSQETTSPVTETLPSPSTESPQPSLVKSRAQEWREELEHAIAQARAAREAAEHEAKGKESE